MAAKRRRVAPKQKPFDPTDVLDSVMVDPEFDEVKTIDIEDYIANGKSESYD